MSYIILALLASLIWAFANNTDKILRTKFVRSSLGLACSFCFISFPLSFSAFLILGFPKTPIIYSIAAFFAGVFLLLCLLCYLKALSMEEASRVVPLWHLTPIFTLILAVIFLGEVLKPLHYLAFFAILVGGFLISVKKIQSVFSLSPALLIMVLSSFFAAISDVLLKFAHEANSVWQIFALFYFASSLTSAFLFLSKKNRDHAFNSWKKHRITLGLIASFSVIMGFIGYLLWNFAVLEGPISILTVFVGFQSLFVLIVATILSYFFPKYIKEEIDMKTIGMKLLAIALMLVGLALLSF